MISASSSSSLRTKSQSSRHKLLSQNNSWQAENNSCRMAWSTDPGRCGRIVSMSLSKGVAIYTSRSCCLELGHELVEERTGAGVFRVLLVRHGYPPHHVINKCHLVAARRWHLSGKRLPYQVRLTLPHKKVWAHPVCFIESGRQGHDKLSVSEAVRTRCFVLKLEPGCVDVVLNGLH